MEHPGGLLSAYSPTQYLPHSPRATTAQGHQPTKGQPIVVTLEEAQAVVQEIPFEDLAKLRTWITITEMPRRETQVKVEQAQAELITELQESGLIEKPAAVTVEEAIAHPDKVPAWENPLGDRSKSYLQGHVITHLDRFYESRFLGLNSLEPGTHGVDEGIWRDITDVVTPKSAPDENTAGAVIPFAPGLPVQEGDIVEDEGRQYRVLSSHTTSADWPPNESAALFQPLP